MSHFDNFDLYCLSKQIKRKDIRLPVAVKGGSPKIHDMRQDIQLGAINEKLTLSLRSEAKDKPRSARQFNCDWED